MNSAYPYTRWSIKRDSKLTLLTLANLDYFSIFFCTTSTRNKLATKYSDLFIILLTSLQWHDNLRCMSMTFANWNDESIWNASKNLWKSKKYEAKRLIPTKTGTDANWKIFSPDFEQPERTPTPGSGRHRAICMDNVRELLQSGPG